jgi:hypothetical protein
MRSDLPHPHRAIEVEENDAEYRTVFDKLTAGRPCPVESDWYDGDQSSESFLLKLTAGRPCPVESDFRIIDGAVAYPGPWRAPYHDEIHQTKAGTQSVRAADVVAAGDGWLEALRLGVRLLPAPARARYSEEWRAELAELDSRGARARYVVPLLLHMPHLAWTLRVGSQPLKRR